MTPTRDHEALERAVAGRECMKCQSKPRVAHAGYYGGAAYQGQYIYRCKCGLKENGWPVKPVLVKEEHGIARRYREMTNAQVQRENETGIVKYESLGREVALNHTAVTEKFPDAAKNGLTKNESYIFMQFCKGYGLNPFINEAYIMKPKGSAAAIMVAVQAYVNRAEIHPKYDGMESGLVVEQDGEEREIQGEIVPKGAKVLGGWCKVYRKDRSRPTYIRLPMDAWNKKRNQWNENPNHMIVVRCIGHAMKQALPDLLGRYAERWPDEVEEPIQMERVEFVDEDGVIVGDYDETDEQESEQSVAENATDADTDNTDLLLWASSELGIDEKTARLIIDEAGNHDEAKAKLEEHASKRRK